jgi:hypothetical protein
VSVALAALVGLVFLATGALKAIDSAKFVTQLLRYRLLPRSWVGPASLLAIALEAGLGAALLVNLSPLAIPVAAVVLVAFAALTWWAASSGRVEDCGCYGGLLLLTPAQSVALDALYLALLAAAWVTRSPATPALQAWQIAIVLAAVVLGAVAALSSLRAPIFDLALLRAGRRWRRSWLRDERRDLTTGSHFVVFLSRECPYCKRWVPLLNVIEVAPELPAVTGVMSLPAGELDAFLREHLIRFPIAHMPQSLVSLLTDAYPTAALIENGTIVSKWIGEMPQAYVDRAQQFFEAVSAPRKQAGGFSG